MTNVKVTTWLRRETRNDLSLFRAQETKSEGSGSFVCSGFVGLGLGKHATWLEMHYEAGKDSPERL